MRYRGLGLVNLVAIVASIMLAASASRNPAAAQVVANPATPYTNSGSINGVVFNDGAVHTGDVTNTSTGQITGSGGLLGPVVSVAPATTLSGNIVNNGSITGNGNANGPQMPAAALSVAGSLAGNIVNTGGISGPGGAISVSGGLTGAIVNSGGLGVTSGLEAPFFPAALTTGSVPGGITNAGSISGASTEFEGIVSAAIELTGMGGTPTTINLLPGSSTFGGIILSGLGDTVNITGGSLYGVISGDSAKNGANAGTVNFNLGSNGSISFQGGGIDAANVNVNSGTVLLGYDVTVFNALVNNGVLQPTNAFLSSFQRTITGNYIQTPAGTLALEITPIGSYSAQLNVTKTATLAGTLALLYDPGTYKASTYTLLTAQSISGSFSTVTGVVPTAGLAQLIATSPTSVDLILGPPGTLSPSPTSTPTPIVIVAPTNDTVFTAMTSTLVQGGQLANEMVLDRVQAASSGAEGSPAVASATAPGLQFAQLGPSLAQLGAAASAMSEAVPGGAWFRGIGSFASVNGSSTAPGFSANQGGFLAGYDRPVMPGVIAGIAGGYTHSDVNEHAPASSAVDTGRIMAYGGGFLGGVLWSATTGYAHDSISSDRVITGIGTASENHAGNEASAAAQASLPLAITGLGGPATLTPKAGLRFLYLSEDGFGETGADGFDLSNNGRSTASVQPLVGIDASEMFVAPDGTEITPEVGLAYAHEAADDGRTLTVGTVGGTSFLVQGVKPSRDMLEARAGITARARDDLFLYATYDSVLRTGNTAAQVIEAGLRLRF